MKDSGVEWIGMIPDGWTLVPLQRVADYNTQVLSEDTADDFMFDYIDIGSVSYGKGIEQFQRMAFKDSPSRARRIVQEDDVIVSTVRTYLKACAQVPKYDYPLIASTGFLVLTANKSVNSKYLKYAIVSDSYVSGVEACSVGISYPAINSLDAVKMKIPLAPIAEQQRIADYLDAKCASIDDVIAKTNESIEEYKKLKQAVITEAVTKGVRGNRHMKKSGIEWVDSIPVDWDVVKIKRVMYDVNQQSALKEEQLSVTQDRGIIKSSEAKIANPSVNTEGWKLVMPNDIVFNKYKAHSGVFFVSPFRGIVTFNYNVYRCYKGIHPSFLEYLYKTSGCISEFIKSMKGVGESISPLYMKDLSLIEIPLPSYEEQKEITSHIDSKCAAIDTLISKKQQFIDELTAYKKSLIYEYVTGKKEVPA